MTIREEDKAFIARIYSYVFIGVMLDWIKEDMQGDPKQIVDRLGVLMKGTILDLDTMGFLVFDQRHDQALILV